MEESEKKPNGNGATVGLVIILIILILGGIYIWKAKVRDFREQSENPDTEVAPAVGE